MFAPAKVTLAEAGIIILNCNPHLPFFFFEVNIPNASGPDNLATNIRKI